MKKTQPKSPAKTRSKQTRTQFKPGVSGNPKGRPQGSRNRATIALQELLDGEGEAITRTCVQLALIGNETALRLCMERLIPPTKERRISLKLPAIITATEVSEALSRVLMAVGAGEITPSEGQAVASILEGRRRTIETEDHERRLAAIEESKNEHIQKETPSSGDGSRTSGESAVPGGSPVTKWG